MSNLIKQLDDAFEKVSGETCNGLIKKIRKIEDRFCKEDLEREKVK